jgi:hypothetical protein
MRTLICSLVTVAAIALSTLGCGSTYDCCFNKLYYNCKDQASLDACAGGNLTICDRDPTRDANKCK